MIVINTLTGGKPYDNIKDAVADELYPDPYSYEGHLEKLQAHINLQSEFIAKLVQALCDNGHIKCQQLEEILGYEYEVRLK